MKDLSAVPLDVATLQTGYRSNAFAPVDVIREIYRRIRALPKNAIWICLRSEDEAVEAAAALVAPKNASLFGIPFAVKDNIDVAGLPTTAGCPAFAYRPQDNASVVQQILEQGGLLIGKTNLDQFATGLVGVRSPYGVCLNLFDSAYVSGGSSSGSALAVAAGLVSFALGTDTAGSGRVPAAFGNIIGLKPTKGVLSTRGVVPACRSLDCVSIFSLTAADAETVFYATAGYDRQDPYSREHRSQLASPKKCRIGVPKDQQLDEAEAGYRALFAEAVSRFESLGYSLTTIDAAPFLETAKLLYGGPWVAERFAAVGKFIKEHADSVHPVVRDIILGGEQYSAIDAFEAQYRLETLKKKTEAVWSSIDVLLLPTVPNIYQIKEIEQDPISLNSRLGIFTNFTNLLDLAAIALPGGFRTDGLPFGITLFAPAFSEPGLLSIASSYLELLRPPLGATKMSYPLADGEKRTERSAPDTILTAVVGAHLTGEPLNYQLTELGSQFVRSAKTAPLYRLFALSATEPAKPGLVRVGPERGAAIDLEVWAIPGREFGKFIRKVSTPLMIGTVHLDDDQQVKGFLCEEIALSNATDISEFGGWKSYLRSG